MRILIALALATLAGCAPPESAVAQHADTKECVKTMQSRSNHYLGPYYWGAELSQKKLTEGCEWRLQEGQSYLTIVTKRHRADDWR